MLGGGKDVDVAEVAPTDSEGSQLDSSNGTAAEDAEASQTTNESAGEESGTVATDESTAGQEAAEEAAEAVEFTVSDEAVE